jgi:hypothetical protein
MCNAMQDKGRFPLSGFMLLPPSPIPPYRGVDRNPFQPTLRGSEMSFSSQDLQAGQPAIWMFYPPGWKRDAYRIYEENLAAGSSDDLFLIRDEKAAREIRRIIEPHIGTHEIVACEIWDLAALKSLKGAQTEDFLGYDVAYPGGDFYSAILNGLLYNPHPELTRRYRHLLNGFGLFSNVEPIQEYVLYFRRLVPSEVNSRFCLFQLRVIS